MNRIAMIVLRNIHRMPLLTAKLFFYAAHPVWYSKEQKYRLIQFLAERIQKTGNVEIQVFGKANIPKQTDVFHQVLDDPENVWYKYVMNLWRDIDNDVLKATFLNFGLNASMFGFQEQRRNEEKYGCNIPWAILMD